MPRFWVTPSSSFQASSASSSSGFLELAPNEQLGQYISGFSADSDRRWDLMATQVTTTPTSLAHPTSAPVVVSSWSSTRVISNLVLLVMGAFFFLPMLWLI